MDSSGISRSMDRVNYFAKGGILPDAAADVPDNGMQSLITELKSSVDTNTAMLSTLVPAINAMNERANQPVKAYTLLSDANAQQDLYDRIKKETTITR